MLGKAQARSRDFGGATMSYRKAADLSAARRLEPLSSR
jgi:hypothetical protein